MHHEGPWEKSQGPSACFSWNARRRGDVIESVTSETIVPALTLNDGNSIPQSGFGVYKVDPETTADIVGAALEVGYRHIDTAQMYGNEAGVGEAVRRSGLDRDEVFVTTKLDNPFHRPDDARRTFAESLERLGTDYVDLFLIHWPLPTQYGGDFVSTWQTLVEFQREGRARSIGVSNFQPEHLATLAWGSDVVPAVNQVEVHPYFTNERVRAADRAAGIHTEAWSPIGRGAPLEEPVIRQLAEQVGRTPAQVVLRWHVQRGDIVFPKTTHRERMEENFAIFDFALDEPAMAAISALDRGPNADNFG